MITDLYPYIDTNVILDILLDRRQSSKDIFEKLKSNRMKCCTAYFSLMEVLDTKYEHAYVLKELHFGKSLDRIMKNRDQRNLTPGELDTEYKLLYRPFLVPYKRILDYWYLEELGWRNAIDMMTKYNITAKDAIHVATAVEAKCKYFVSSDSDLRSIAKKFIKETHDPDNFVKKL